MSIQRQYNRHGTTMDAVMAQRAVEERRSKTPHRVKKNRFSWSYRRNPLTTEERIMRAQQLKGKWGINPDVRMSQANPRRKPSKYQPHVGGKGYKAPRPRQVRVQPQMTMTQIFMALKDKFRGK